MNEPKGTMDHIGLKVDHTPIGEKEALPPEKRGPHSTFVSTDAVADLKVRIKGLVTDLKAAVENLDKLDPEGLNDLDPAMLGLVPASQLEDMMKARDAYKSKLDESAKYYEEQIAGLKAQLAEATKPKTETNPS